VLDQLVEANPGRIARVEWHTYSSSPLYNAEGNSKWRLYPPPYNGGYATPWLWVDGRNRGYSYPSWENYVYDELLVESDVSLTHVGTTYDQLTRSGLVKVECYNSGSIPIIAAALQIAITEDSLNYTGTNGDPWHNNVLRDYVPSQHGTTLTLGPGATDTITVPFALDSTWVEDKVNLVVYLQNMTVQADSSLPCYQGLVANVLDFKAGVAGSQPPATRNLRVAVSPNPCRTGCEFTLSGAAAQGARITVYTPDGRVVNTLETSGNTATWRRAGAARGIYLYRVNAGTATAEGKLIVTD
jgi:hypothetical protein